MESPVKRWNVKSWFSYKSPMDHGRRWGLRGKTLAWPLCRPQQRPHPLHRSWRDFPDAKFVVAVAFSNLALIHEYVCRKTCLKFLLSKGHKCFTHQPRLAQVYKTAMCKFFEQGRGAKKCETSHENFCRFCSRVALPIIRMGWISYFPSRLVWWFGGLEFQGWL